MLSHTSTEWAPWYVIPADRKWFARFAAAAVLVHTLMRDRPPLSTVTRRQRQALREAKQALEAQAPDGAPADGLKRSRHGANAGGGQRPDGRAPKRRASEESQPAPGA